MPWPITFRGERPADPRVGDAYFVPEAHVRRHVDHGYPLAWALALTKAFELAGRRPIAVVLPCGYHLCIDTAYWGGRWGENPQRVGWAVQIAGPIAAGEKLDVTLSPSVNIGGSYHGWIQGGIISEDVEGRRFA
jgi:hypothetical protein